METVFLKDLLLKYRSVVRFVVLFMGSYLVMSLFYAGYLHRSKGDLSTPDPITQLVAGQTNALLNTMGYQAGIVPDPELPSMNLYLEGRYLARIIEGCNSISVIILFLSFIIAFAQGWKKTMFFLLAGAALIYSVNVIRIALLSIALYHYPEQEHFLHGVVFPAMIYGMVFLLWMAWIRTLKAKTQPHE